MGLHRSKKNTNADVTCECTSRLARANTLSTTYGVFTLTDTMADTNTANRWLVQNCEEVFTMHRDKYQDRFPLGSVPFL